jgi:TM2 domain-containing membrane protein YozV
VDPTKRCPLCGEIILVVALRCRYCQGDLSQSVPKVLLPDGTAPAQDMVPAVTPSYSPSIPAHSPAPTAPAGPVSQADFEQRFLEFVYTTDYIINAPTVAYALKVPIEEATEQLEDLAARDVLIREVDARGSVFFHLPGRQLMRQATAVDRLTGASPTASTPYQYPPTGLVPYGTTSLDMRDSLTTPSEGTALAALLVNTLCLPGLGSIIGGRSSAGIGQLLLFLIGIPLTLLVVGAPMILSAWIWALITGIDIMNQAKQAQTQRRLTGG